MIQQKLDIRYVIKSLNELEKLKLLLFDKDQYVLFEHIPKPILIEKGTLFGFADNSKNTEEKFLMTNGSTFWAKTNNREKYEKDFNEALEKVRMKKEPNVIDQRLIEVMDDFGS